MEAKVVKLLDPTSPKLKVDEIKDLPNYLKAADLERFLKIKGSTIGQAKGRGALEGPYGLIEINQKSFAYFEQYAASYADSKEQQAAIRTFVANYKKKHELESQDQVVVNGQEKVVPERALAPNVTKVEDDQNLEAALDLMNNLAQRMQRLEEQMDGFVKQYIETKPRLTFDQKWHIMRHMEKLLDSMIGS